MINEIGPYGFFKQAGKTGILFVHGVTGTPTEMVSFSKYFEAKGYTVACPQLGGHCGTYNELKESHWQDWYRSVENAYLFLTDFCDKIFTVGLSLGALLCLKLHKKHKHKLVATALISPSFFLDGWNMHWPQKIIVYLVIHSPLKYFLSFREGPPYGIKDESTRQNLEAILHSQQSSPLIGQMDVPANTLAEGSRLIASTKKDLAHITTPVIIVHSREDEMCSIKNVEFLEESLASDTIETFIISDSYHIITMDKKARKAADAIIEFFNSIDVY